MIEKSDEDNGDSSELPSVNSNRIGLSSRLKLGQVLESISNNLIPGGPRIDHDSPENSSPTTIRGIPDSRDVLDIFIFCKTHFNISI